MKPAPERNDEWVDEHRPAPPESAAGDTEPMLYCPACDQRLEQHKCKLVCNRCGYYMSCADYY